MEFQSLLQESKSQVVMAVAGLVVLGFGIFQMWQGSQGSDVEIIAPENQVAGKESGVVVDVAGAVENPGVYRLDAGSRVVDALVAAGGLSGVADRDWIARHINQAELAQDGNKIYIPAHSEQVNDQLSITNDQVTGVEGVRMVNVNTASKSELDSLWGIGEARAEAIIVNRPYGSLDEVKEKAGIPENVIEANKEIIVVY